MGASRTVTGEQLSSHLHTLAVKQKMGFVLCGGVRGSVDD
jgi:hypothetical protein